MGGIGKAHAATGRGGRHRERQQQVGDVGKAQAAIGSGGRHRDGTGSDRERWEAEGMHRQRQ